MARIKRWEFDFKGPRKEAGIKQKDAAEALGVTISTIRRWESGGTYPDAARVMELAQLYGCSVDHLLGIDGSE